MIRVSPGPPGQAPQPAEHDRPAAQGPRGPGQGEGRDDGEVRAGGEGQAVGDQPGK